MKFYGSIFEKQPVTSFIFILILLNCNPAWSAKWTPPREHKPSFKFGIVGGSLGMSVNDPKDRKLTSVDYEPNNQGRILVGVTYLGYSLTGGFSGEPSKEEITQKGRTKGTDYQFRFFKEQNTFDVFYQKYQGYFINNSSEIDGSYANSKNYIQRADLHTEHYGVQYFRSLSPEEFSMSACFEQNGWQKESGGTWFYYSAYDTHHIDADSSIIPDSLKNSYLKIQDFSRGDFNTLKIGFGGAYALVYNNLFFASQLILAGGQQKQSYYAQGSTVQKTLPTSGANIKLSTGYNGDSFFSSINFFNDNTNLIIEDKQVSLSTVEFNIVFGVHF